MSTADQPTSIRQVDKKTLHQAIAGSALGNAVEWFDYGVYGYLTTYMAILFFTTEDKALGQVFALGLLTISFLIRPIGGMVLGPLGDRVGRQRVLVITITLMTVATGGISLLPTNESFLGVWAFLPLMILRLVQGFSTGGEYGGAAVFMSEYAPNNRRGFYGSFLEFGTLAGTVLAAVLCTILIASVGEEGMLDGWWRLPFAVTVPLGFVALWLRTKLKEPPVFEEASENAQTSKRPFADLLRDHWRRLLVLTGFVLMLNVSYYLVLVYMPGYLSQTLGHDAVQSNFTLVGIMLVMMVIIAPLGGLTDKIGRKTMLAIAAASITVLSIPAVMLINTTSPWLQGLGLAMLGLQLVVMQASVSSTLPALFPTKVRYSGFAIGYNISTALFGGTAGTLVALLVQQTGNNLVPGFYLAASGVIGLISIFAMRETAQATLRGDEIPGRPESVGMPNSKYVEENRADTEALEAADAGAGDASRN